MKLKTIRKEETITIRRGLDIANFIVLPLDPKDSQALLTASTDVSWERGQRFESVDWYRYKILKINKVIKGWSGIEDEAGNPLPCDDHHRELLYLNNTSIIDEVIDKADALAGRVSASNEALAKNLKSGPDGVTKTE